MSNIDVTKLYSVGETVTLNQLIKLMGIPSGRIKGFINSGMPHKVSGNTTLFDTVATTRWIIAHEIEQTTNVDEEHMTVNEAKRRGEVAKTLTLELMLAKEREQLANIDDLMNNFTQSLIQVRAKIISQSSRLSGIMSHQSQKDIIAMLDDDANEMLETLSEYKHEYIRNESGSTTTNSTTDKPSLPPMPKATPKIKSS